MDKKLNIIISGGGTGGHLIPAFAIADAFLSNDSDVEIVFLGSKKGIESKLYKQRNEKHYLLKTVGLNREISIKSIYHNLIVFPYSFIHAMFKTFKIFRKFNPDIVIGTGGYSSAIPLFVAYLKGVKIFIQEQNSVPGLVNKIFLRKANMAFFGIEPKYSNNIKYMVSGNPTKSRFNKSKISSHRNKKLFTILIIGGSQGSVPINNHFLKNYKKYLENWNDVRLIWQCGEKNIDIIKDKVKSEYIELHGFINDIEKFYLISDLIISRSGALTLTEISNYEKASILIPFPYAANNHQLFNANYYKNYGACKIVEQKYLDDGLLEKTVDELINNKDLIKQLEKKAFEISKPNASKKIVEEIFNHV